MLTLGVESSCDETAASVVEDLGLVRSNVIHTQIPIHARYGGVVPELASRNHIMAILPVIEEALTEAGTRLESIDLIAVTHGPGLTGSLLVGVETAKALGYCHDTAVCGINHVEAHLLSPFLESECRKRLRFPYIGLVVSGGHTSLFLARGIGQYRLLGRTLDDAAGEAFDKIAKRLGAPYPGGPYIQRTAFGGAEERFALPRPLLHRGLDFSFSGLKTAAANLISKLEREDPRRSWLRDFCASVQRAVSDVLVFKTLKAARQNGCAHAAIAGGVAANSRLRELVQEVGKSHGIDVIVPPPTLCTDNGAMIANVGFNRYSQLAKRPFSQFDLDAIANLPVKQLRN